MVKEVAKLRKSPEYAENILQKNAILLKINKLYCIVVPSRKSQISYAESEIST